MNTIKNSDSITRSECDGCGNFRVVITIDTKQKLCRYCINQISSEKDGKRLYRKLSEIWSRVSSRI